MQHRWSVISLLAVAMVIAAARAQPAGPSVSPAGEPTTSPATQPVLPASAATPKDALKIFAAAMRDGDADKLASVVLTASPVEARMLGSMAALAGALARLNQSALKAFGQDDAARFTDDDTAHFAETLARIDAADVIIGGDKATVRYRGPGETPFEMRRVVPHGSQDGQWKVPMSAISPGADADALDQRLSELKVQRKIVEELADEIADGKYTSAASAKEAWRGKIMQTLPTRPPGPATAPFPTTRTTPIAGS